MLVLSLRRMGACVCSALLVASVHAQQGLAGSGESIALPDALERTLARSPELIAFDYQIAAAEGRLRQARLAPNPELNATVEDVLGSGSLTGLDSAETTVTLGWILERGLRQRIVDAAQAGVSLRGADAEVLRLDAAAETARRFIDCLAQQARIETTARAVQLAEETVTAVQGRVAAGLAPEAELARAEAELARAELAREDVEHELSSAYRRLSAQWGDTEPDFGAVSGELRALPRGEPFEALLSRLERNPELARFATQQRLDEAEVRLAEARSRPSWRISGGIRRFEGIGDHGLVAGITVPLPIRDRNQGRVMEARAELARTEAEATAARVGIETTLFTLYQEFQHDLHVAMRLGEDVIPRIESALADTRRAYELGRYSYYEWRTVQAELLQASNDLLDVTIDAHRIVIEIERLTGARFALPSAAQ